MLIGIDAREFVEKGKTGIGRYLENLLAPLIRGAGIDFVLFVTRREFIPESLCAPSVRIVALPALPTLVLDQVILPCLARRAGVDVFFSPYYKVPLSGKFKRIITVHDIIFLRQEGLNPFTRFLVARQLRASARKADIILVDSDFTGKDLVDFLPKIKCKIHRLYPDLCSDWLKPVDPADISRIQAKYLDGRPYLLYVGNFKPHKNCDLLVKAFARLVRERQGNDRRLLLVGGDAVNLRRIMKLIHQHGMANHIIIHPNVSDFDLRGLYAMADWFITASDYEGFGYPPLEALAAGCPLICSPCTSLAEVVGNAALEISGLTVEGVMNALLQAFSMKPAERLNLVERGKKQARQFLPGSSAANFSRILSELARPPQKND